MLADAADYSYRRPIETARAAIDILYVEWGELTDAPRRELEALLDKFRTDLFLAKGDYERGTVMNSLPYALEATPSLPASAVALLRADHRSKVSSRLLAFDSLEARAFIQQLDALLGSPPEPATSTATPASDEVFPDAARIARGVTDGLNVNWAQLSLRQQDQVHDWLQQYDRELAAATNDHERLNATYDFLRQVKSDPAIYRLVETEFTRRGGPVPDFRPGMQVMVQQDADRIRAAIDRSPAMVIAKTPMIAANGGALEESAAPPATTEEASPQPAASGVVDYHTDVRFPGQVSTFDQNIPLRVRLALEKSDSSVVDETVSIEFITPDPQQVLVVCNAEGFIVDGADTVDTTRTILVYPGQDSQWAVFLLTPDPDAGPGTRRISLDFYHRERLAGTASFQVEVRDRPPIEDIAVEPEPVIEDRNADGSVTRVTGTLLLAAADALKPDFVLRITLSADRGHLSYALHSPTGKLGLVYQRMGSVKLENEPRVLMENTLNRLSQMARASREKLTNDQIAAAQAALRDIGWYLYDELFTPRLRQAYRQMHELRQQQANLSLLVISDEPWIPWEMVLPHEGLDGEDFLCAQFRMTRWLDGRGLPQDIDLRQVRVVVPRSNLASVKQEQAYFSQQLPSSVSFDGEWLDTAMEVKAALQQRDTQWFHFACHGDFVPDRPDESALLLQGEPFTPSQIVGPMREGVAASRPLVFLNACHTAEVGFSLTQMGGWAARFVRAGATAFVGSLWEVNDVLAAKFAIKFYGELLAGQTLGDAFHTARDHIREEDRANPTWLAYTLYADPNGRVKPVSGER